MDDESEASLYVDIGPSPEEPLFTGAFVDMCDMVWVMPAASRLRARIVTADWTYEPAQLEYMRCKDGRAI
jgi:hypothetical protein